MGALGSLIAASPVVAQVTPPVTAPTREEVQRAPVRPREPARPRLTVEGGIERAPCLLDTPENRNVRFTLNRVEFEELKGVDSALLRPAYQDFLGTEQSIAVLCEIRDRAATLLREAGYIAAVQVPEQRIQDGTVRYTILMAKLVALRVRGDAGKAERTIARYLERLTREEVFNSRTAERYLLLAGDVPGYDVRLALRSANAGRGEVIGEVTVVRSPGQLDFNVQNFGSPELGRFGGLLRGQLYDLTGMGDRTTIALFTTLDLEEQQTLQLGHDFRLGGEGLVLSGQFTYAWADPDFGDPNFDVEARTLLATVEASYPLVRSQARSARASFGFDFIDQDVDFNDLPLSRDRLRVGYLRLDLDGVDRPSIGGIGGYTAAEPRWRASGNVQLRKGLAILGASEECGPTLATCSGAGAIVPSRVEGEATGASLRLEAYAEYRPDPAITFALGVRAQYSEDALLSFEEFSAGNYTVGRGYDPGTLLGDSGIGLQAELRFGRLVPTAAADVALQPYVFADAAWVRNEDRLTVPVGRQSLSSLGAGVRAVFGDRAQLDVAFALPLERAGLFSAPPDPRLLVSLTTRLWPWSSR